MWSPRLPAALSLACLLSACATTPPVYRLSCPPLSPELMVPVTRVPSPSSPSLTLPDAEQELARMQAEIARLAVRINRMIAEAEARQEQP